MTDQWFCAENGKSVGPLSTQELANRLRQARGGPYLVWAPGMAEWVDARALPQFSPQPLSSKPSSPKPLMAEGAPKKQMAAKTHAIVQRARHEFVSYIAVSAYLMIWFVAVMFYKSTVLRSVGVEFAPFGLAVVKALILGKFMLVLEALKLGEREESRDVLIVQILKKALLFTVALVFLSIVEELVVGHFHGKSAKDVMSEIGGGSLAQVFATSILMFLVLMPYLAFRRLAMEFGTLPEMLFTRRSFKKD